MNIPCRYFLLSLTIIAVYSGLAVHAALFAPLDSAIYLFSENGPYEFFSPWLWYALAALCLLSGTLASPTRQFAAVSAFMMGMREMDLHKALFEMSFLKSRFYTDGNIALSHKLIGLALIVLLLGLLVYLTKTFYQTLKFSDKPLPLSFRYTVLASCSLASSIFLDRLHAQISDLFHIQLHPRIAVVIQALEESTEMLVPLLLCVALLIYRNTKPS